MVFLDFSFFFHIGPFLPFIKAPDTLPKIPILGVMGILSHGPPEEMAGWIMVFLGATIESNEALVCGNLFIFLLSRNHHKAMTFVFVIGSPMAGKSSLCRELGKYARFRYVGVGELIRANTKYAEDIEKHLRLGQLIPDSMCFEILREELKGWTEEKNIIFLIDGFPRSLSSLKIWRENGMPEPLLVLHLYADMDTLLKRRGRRELTEHRCDDKLSIFLNRIESFETATSAVIKHFGPLVVKMKSNLELNSIREEVLSMIIQKHVTLNTKL